MRGYIVLSLLGEKVARKLRADGVDGAAAFEWLEEWNRLVSESIRADVGGADATSGWLLYRLLAARQLVDVAVADDAS